MVQTVVYPNGFRQLHNEMNRLFDQFARPAQWRSGRTYPAVNAWEDNDNYYVEAELPGFADKDIDISAVGNQLAIKASRSPEKADNATWHRRERSAGSFGRVLNLPGDIDADKIEATLKNGVLTVTLPKAEAAKPRRITVKSK